MNIKYKFLAASFMFAVSFFTAIQINAAGEVDPNFIAQAYRGDVDPIYNAVYKVIQQPDGKILVGGNFKIADGVEKCSIARLNADLSVDNSFQPPSELLFGTYICFGVQTLALQSDGKILIGGNFYSCPFTGTQGIRRLNPDGSLDQSFSAFLSIYGSVTNIEIQTDGKIILTGLLRYFDSNNILRSTGSLRLNSNGSLDTGYNNQNAGGFGVKAQTDGKIIIYSGSAIVRRNPDGTIDNSFPTVNVNGIVRAIETDSNGKILIGGDFTTVNGFAKSYLARLNSDGSLDATFNTGNAGPNVRVTEINFAPNGKLLIVGSFTTYNGMNLKYLARLNSDGTIDNTFTFVPLPNQVVLSALTLPNGKILAGVGTMTGVPPQPGHKLLVLLNDDGSADNPLNVGLGGNGIVRKVAQQPDGKVLVAGSFRFVNGNIPKIGIARFNSDGTVDNTFNQTAELDVRTLALQPDGKIVIGTFNGSPTLKRLNSDGSLDTTFNSTGNFTINDIEVLPDGKLLVGTSTYLSLGILHRRNSDGSLDNTFTPVSGNSSQDGTFEIEVQPDGKILIGGKFTQISSVPRGNFARLNPDGTIDSSFNPPFGANAPVTDIDYQSNGKVIIVGDFTGVNGTTSYQKIARLNTDGSLDTSFSQPSITKGVKVEVMPDDRILITDEIFIVGDFIAHTKVLRLSSNGVVDSSFATTTNDTIADLQLQNDGNILIGGDFTRVNGLLKTDIARLLNAAAPQGRARFDYDGDGRSDVSVFRPSNGTWYLNQSTNGFGAVQFGISTDLIAPADFDGDGKTDIAVFRPSNGTWYYMRSSDNGFAAVQFGTNGDIPIPGDFDGDGKADINVFRPSNGVWYRLNSSNGGFVANAFGQNGDIPLSGDFNGDGKADLAVFRPSAGYWYIAKTTGIPGQDFDAIPFGVSTDIPTPADYDGDGKTDVSVFRPSNGNWYRLNSSDGAFAFAAFGQNGDIPVASDYDGDGKANLAVFRPSTSSWYIARPTGTPAQNFDSIPFGVSTDKPTPSAFQQ